MDRHTRESVPDSIGQRVGVVTLPCCFEDDAAIELARGDSSLVASTLRGLGVSAAASTGGLSGLGSAVIGRGGVDKGMAKE